MIKEINSLRIGFSLKFIKYFLILVVLLMVGCSVPLTDENGAQEEKTSVEAAVSGEVALGQEVYETGGSSGVPCLACHTLDGTNTVGPTFKGIADVAGDRVDGVSAEEYLRQSITNPGAYIVVGYSNAMNQNYASSLSEEEIDTVVAYLLTLSDE